MQSILQNIFSKYWNTLKKGVLPQEDYIRVLENMGQELNFLEPCKNIKNSLKILMGPSLSTYPPCFLHDRILSYTLRLRGATIIPLYCDSIQTLECNVSGGVWKGHSFKKSCKYCSERSGLLWHNNPVKALKLSEYINDEEISEINKKFESLDNNWADYEEGRFSFGRWAKDILVNNYVVGDYHLVPQHNELGKNHVRNLLLLKTAYRNIIRETKPDRVVTNDSYYGMWAILQKICEEKGIPFYSHWMGGRPDGWCYAYNDAAMNLDFLKPWKSFVKIPLTEAQIKKVRNWTGSRSSGKGMILDTASLQAFNTDKFDFSKIDTKKPTALLPSNVIWDLAALNKQVIFSDMIDWIAQTIYWFADHPEYQLIVKIHPGELHPGIPETKEGVEIALSRRNVKIPSNVFLLTPHVNCTVYDLLPLSTAGIVHTTTVGIEMAARGIPVITTGRSPYRGFGFTLDPTTTKDYFHTIEGCLSGREQMKARERIENAEKFILFYQFHYYTRINIMDFTWGKAPRIKVQSIHDLAPGKNKYLDYIVDSIMDGKPIVSENRWPPES
jgi:hypothetical protein